MRPLIGVTGRRYRLNLIAGADARYGDRCTDGYMADFATRIARAGGLPVHLSYDTDATDVCQWLSGVVITGGQDVHPACWGGDTAVVRDIDPRTDPMVHDPARDAYEIGLVRAALERGIPVLGCAAASRCSMSPSAAPSSPTFHPAPCATCRQRPRRPTAPSTTS